MRTVRARTAIAAATLAIGAGLALAPAAQANTTQGYIAGGGSVTDDWGDEGLLSSSSHANSNATAVWQWVLWAEGAKESNGTRYDQSDIDCQFGPNTTYATKNLQSTWGLIVDGKVGTQTFGNFDAFMDLGSDGQTVTYYGAYFDGHAHKFTLKRISGKYYVQDPGSGKGWKGAYYNSKTAC